MAMTFWDEVDWTEVDQIETRSLVLVDHNKMTDQLAAHFKPHQVRQVLDHHAGWQRIDRERCHLTFESTEKPKSSRFLWSECE